MERLRHYYLEMVSSQRSFARMKLEEKALQKVARTTLEYYDRHAERFWEGIRAGGATIEHTNQGDLEAGVGVRRQQVSTHQRLVEVRRYFGDEH